tara:strand:+ start:1802 stop:2950 length:1149 start_codon:yes stop_codon:yes gene_type:complete
MNRILFFLVFSVFLGCNNHQQEDHRVDLKIYRFENDFFSINESNISQKTQQWNKVNNTFIEGAFVPFIQGFVENANKPLSISDSVFLNELLIFATVEDFKDVYDSIRTRFSDFTEIENSLEQAFGRFFYFFPNSNYNIPNITTFFSGFNYAVFTYPGKDTRTYDIAIGLDYFLGSGSKFYTYLGAHEYERFKFQKKFIPSYVMQVWFDMCYEDKLNKYMFKTDLLTQMIFLGKKMYFVDQMLPNIPLHDKLGFSKKQMEWLLNNEKNIWSYIIEKDMLFSTDETKFRQFIHEGPFVKGLPEEAPSRLGYYMGYQIIANYLQENEIAIEELLVNDLESEEYIKNYQPENNNSLKKPNFFSTNTFKIIVGLCFLCLLLVIRKKK